MTTVLISYNVIRLFFDSIIFALCMILPVLFVGATFTFINNKSRSHDETWKEIHEEENEIFKLRVEILNKEKKIKEYKEKQSITDSKHTDNKNKGETLQ